MMYIEQTSAGTPLLPLPREMSDPTTKEFL